MHIGKIKYPRKASWLQGVVVIIHGIIFGGLGYFLVSLSPIWSPIFLVGVACIAVCIISIAYALITWNSRTYSFPTTRSKKQEDDDIWDHI